MKTMQALLANSVSNHSETVPPHLTSSYGYGCLYQAAQTTQYIQPSFTCSFHMFATRISTEF